MFDTIQVMSHMVRTAYGDSKLTNGGDIIPNDFMHFMMGLYQGNVSAPQAWSIISSVVFSALLPQVLGIHFEDSFKSKVAHLLEFSYVELKAVRLLDASLQAYYLYLH